MGWFCMPWGGWSGWMAIALGGLKVRSLTGRAARGCGFGGGRGLGGGGAVGGGWGLDRGDVVNAPVGRGGSFSLGAGGSGRPLLPLLIGFSSFLLSDFWSSSSSRRVGELGGVSSKISMTVSDALLAINPIGGLLAAAAAAAVATIASCSFFFASSICRSFSLLPCFRNFTNSNCPSI